MTQLCKTYAGEDQTYRIRKDLDVTLSAHNEACVQRVIKVVETAIHSFSVGETELLNIFTGTVASQSRK